MSDPKNSDRGLAIMWQVPCRCFYGIFIVIIYSLFGRFLLFRIYGCIDIISFRPDSGFHCASVGAGILQALLL